MCHAKKLLKETIHASLLWAVIGHPVPPGETPAYAAYLTQIKVRRNY